MSTFISDLSGKTYPIDQRIELSSLRPTVRNEILNTKSSIPANGVIARAEVQLMRQQYITRLLVPDSNDPLSDIEREVLDRITKDELISDELDDHSDEHLTVGQKVADVVADFGGSWTFLIIFGILIMGWIGLNVWVLSARPFDPYPFILLNLFLSCLAAIQAPIIMMSQNRQEERDRQRARADYKVNLKAEVEIRMLHDKIDLLLEAKK
ncbi:MAG: DUF1003 domain-containing protein ['Candidatus Kapabacteria' thiocyanatum]|uniref:Cyclic nucleotide-binding protein n=1 Tax=Candidatus Kapaibacterium thiocyanatum TaxID=1895771 RepID=A0A1M3KV65_9BACT|nr:DUF1003 domain-containing protein ['Candidatus Kapabacteria' thiocyanatum]OJX56303.1 MAG: hypothetical protein BGO89_13275 ['Candidatus Kapabacteria' thiocyanatum]